MAGSAGDNHRTVIKEAVQRFVDARLQGLEPDIDEFVGNYPGMESQIRQGIEDMLRIDALFDSLVRPDDSDFEETLAACGLIGRRIGSLEVVEMIGRGGMGVVYLARDTRLGREVAVKSIPSELAHDATARSRFEREAKVLASLNHPNIAVIHDIIEEGGGASYLVLEYIQGETLAEQIACGPLAPEQALLIGRQIAEGLLAAHRKGVVHRDLKPANIKITPDGRVKVLDFGLAKARVDESESGQITATEPGHVMGTPAYMSPEQARGKAADHRTDIWSFGCIMYEMLTGCLPFKGETATDTLARIIEREPDWELLPPGTPANIRALLQRCLEKEASRRLGHIGEAAAEIGQTLTLSGTGRVAAAPARLRTLAITVGVAVIIVLAALAVWLGFGGEAQPGSKLIRIVVLPFENLGPPENEYFADGVTDAITARLGNIGRLGVISRQSAIQYKNKEMTPREIATDLKGLDYILEGTVQYERPLDTNSRVRILPQLISVSDDTHIWAQTYDCNISEYFDTQFEIAESVARAMDITLLKAERRALAYKPTANTKALDFFMRAEELVVDDDKAAIVMYNLAIKEDGEFALAWAQLSRAHLRLYHTHKERTRERLEKAREAVEEALQLAPELPEARLAYGQYYYHGLMKYPRALEELGKVLESQPNNFEALFLIGCIYRRLGEFEDALRYMANGAEMSPRSLQAASNRAETLRFMRRFEEAEQVTNEVISRARAKVGRCGVGQFLYNAWMYVQWKGDTETARKLLKEATENILSDEDVDAVDLITSSVAIVDGNYAEALELRLNTDLDVVENQHQFTPRALRCGEICVYMKDHERAKKYFEQARNYLLEKVAEDPNDARYRSSLGIAYAGLDQTEDAVREGEYGTTLVPLETDAMRGAVRLEDLAKIYAMVGRHDDAISTLEHLLSIPSLVTRPLLRRHPVWKDLREKPSFKKLLREAP